MAFTAFATTSVAPGAAGLVTYAATDNVNGNAVTNNGLVELRLKNPTAGSLTVTVASVADSYGRIGDIVQAIAAGAEYVVGLLPPSLWNQRSVDVGTVHVTFSGAGITMAAIQLG
jgi:hypothetical protein